jgi:RimJ/RimL family protein N-acetyltransferase
MVQAQQFNSVEQLKSGLTATIRAVRPDDKELINEAFKNLEPETIYTRYFQHKTQLSEADLRWATELDFESDVALVVTIENEGKEIVIGGSRYSVLKTTEGAAKSAEIAFTVEEDFQGQGIASRLLRHMINSARQQGIASFEAEVLPGNTSMLTVFKRSGLPLARSLEDGTIHLTMTLTET